MKNDSFTSIRVKKNTKGDVNKFLDKANKTEDCGKITFDALISYFLKNVTNEDIEKLQMESITWAHEDKRLKRLWEKKKGTFLKKKRTGDSTKTNIHEVKQRQVCFVVHSFPMFFETLRT